MVVCVSVYVWVGVCRAIHVCVCCMTASTRQTTPHEAMIDRIPHHPYPAEPETGTRSGPRFWDQIWSQKGNPLIFAFLEPDPVPKTGTTTRVRVQAEAPLLTVGQQGFGLHVLAGCGSRFGDRNFEKSMYNFTFRVHGLTGWLSAVINAGRHASA